MIRLRLMQAVAVAAVIPVVAFAHAHLITASPAENATVVAPTQIVLFFTQPLERGFSAIEVWDAKGKRVDGDTLPADPDGKHLAIGLPKKLPPGTYEVIWHATSVDTHRTEGNFTFTIAP